MIYNKRSSFSDSFHSLKMDNDQELKFSIGKNTIQTASMRAFHILLQGSKQRFGEFGMFNDINEMKHSIQVLKRLQLFIGYSSKDLQILWKSSNEMENLHGFIKRETRLDNLGFLRSIRNRLSKQFKSYCKDHRISFKDVRINTILMDSKYEFQFLDFENAELLKNEIEIYSPQFLSSIQDSSRKLYFQFETLLFDELFHVQLKKESHSFTKEEARLIFVDFIGSHFMLNSNALIGNRYIFDFKTTNGRQSSVYKRLYGTDFPFEEMIQRRRRACPEYINRRMDFTEDLNRIQLKSFLLDPELHLPRIQKIARSIPLNELQDLKNRFLESTGYSLPMVESNVIHSNLKSTTLSPKKWFLFIPAALSLLSLLWIFRSNSTFH